MKRIAVMLTATVLAISFAAPAQAQFARADLSGTVLDPDGAPLPGVTATVRNEATAAERTTFTSATDGYNFNGLIPSSYTVTFALAGFNTSETIGVVLAIGADINLDATLELGGIAETVTGESPLVDCLQRSRWQPDGRGLYLAAHPGSQLRGVRGPVARRTGFTG